MISHIGCVDGVASGVSWSLFRYGAHVSEQSRTAKIKILHALMAELYLSTACAAGDHLSCRLVDKYRALVCCCTGCDHEGRSPSSKVLTGPLLHPIDDDSEKRPGYIYRGGLGRRDDLVRMATAVLLDAREDDPCGKLWKITDRIALWFAPRIG